MTDFFPEFTKAEIEVIACWGEAKLIRTLDGKYELAGGSKDDMTQAREWISMFMPDAVIRER